MMADMEEEMRKRGWGGVKIRGETIYTLAYADDVVLLADEKDGMRCMMRNFEKYIKEKGFELNVDKSKVVRFRKGGEREKRRSGGGGKKE